MDEKRFLLDNGEIKVRSFMIVDEPDIFWIWWKNCMKVKKTQV